VDRQLFVRDIHDAAGYRTHCHDGRTRTTCGRGSWRHGRNITGIHAAGPAGTEEGIQYVVIRCDMVGQLGTGVL
jgi:hypothetical protein